ncbi:MAG TPA: hypothetical protein VF516_00360 [Kofleriaceae bacterium]
MIKKTRIAVTLACWMVSACATIQSSTTYSQTLLTTRTSVVTNPNSRSYTSTTEVEGHDLLVTLRSEESCRTSVVAIYRKEAHVTRTPTTGPLGLVMSPTTSLVAGLLLGGLGAYSYLRADSLAMTGESSQSTPADYRTTGLVSGAIGGGLLVASLVDSIRLRDTTGFVGDVEGAPDVRTDPCHAQIFSNRRVGASVATLAWEVAATSDGSGQVRLDLHGLPESAFAAGELQLELHLIDTIIPLKVAAEPTRQLLEALAADTTSRVSSDREARAVTLCEEHVAAASAVSIEADTPADAIAQAETRWSAARATCGARWQSTHEQQFMAYRAKLAATAAQRARNQCATAGEAAAQLLDRSNESGERVDLDAIARALAERCSDATNAKPVQDSVIARAHQLQRARAQAEKARTQAENAAADELDESDPSPRQWPLTSGSKVCTKGCPCGNTCISCTKTCGKAPGTEPRVHRRRR